MAASTTDKAFASKEALDYWSPVDWYNGGMEHTTLHLLYSRFWHKFLYDICAVPTKEPYAKRTSHGMILGEGGEKMSKSRGNVVNPNDIVAQYGADTMRLQMCIRDRVDGVLLLLNTVGGDIEAGLAIAELAAGMTKPVVTLVLGAGTPSAYRWRCAERRHSSRPRHP